MESTDSQLHMKYQYGTQHKLWKFDPRFGSKTMEVILAHDRNNPYFISELSNKASNWEDKICTWHIHKN